MPNVVLRKTNENFILDVDTVVVISMPFVPLLIMPVRFWKPMFAIPYDSS